MRPLFFFGTLCHLPLLEAVIGDVSHLSINTARLPGFDVRAVTEGPFPGIIAEPEARAPGILVEGLRDSDLERLNFYEGAFDYTLCNVVLEGGQDAQSYFPTPGSWTFQGPWSVDTWARDWGTLSILSAREVMSHFGEKSEADIRWMFPMIRSRAWSQMNAGHSRHGSGTLQGHVDVTAHHRSHAQYFALDMINVVHERFDGSRSNPVAREVFIDADAVIVLPYDPVRDRVLLVEQIRMGPIVRGDPSMWQLEPVAGRVDPGEAPENTARREALEEAGLTLAALHPVAEAYCSPGNSTAFYYVYVGLCDLPDGTAGLGGLASEDEDIRSHLMGFEALMDMCDAQRAANAPLALAAYWLARHRERLRAMT